MILNMEVNRTNIQVELIPGSSCWTRGNITAMLTLFDSKEH